MMIRLVPGPTKSMTSGILSPSSIRAIRGASATLQTSVVLGTGLAWTAK